MLSQPDLLRRLPERPPRSGLYVRLAGGGRTVATFAADLKMRWLSRTGGSSIWRRFALYLSGVTGLFLLLTILIVLRVSLPQASDAARRATDREILAHEIQQLTTLRAEIVSRGAAPEVLAAVDEASRERARRLDDLEALDQMLRAERSPEGLEAQDRATRSLESKLDAILARYPYESEIEKLHYRMAMMLVLIFVCLAGTTFVFIRDVIDPLEGLISTSREVRSGDLSVTFPVREEGYQHDELDELATVLNDLLANFQEAFLLIVALNKEVRSHLEAMVPVLDGVASDATREALREVHEEALTTANEVGEIVGSFEFYRARSDGARLSHAS